MEHTVQNMIIDRMVGIYRAPSGDDAEDTRMFADHPGGPEGFNRIQVGGRIGGKR